MSDTGLALGGLIIGAVVSFAISLYFFKKSVNRRLSAYLQFASQVLAGVDDPVVRESLEIHYRGAKIDDLLQLQFVIANEGQRAIRDLLEPLSITLPKRVKLLEARIPHIEPKGREVTLSTEELPDGRTKVSFMFKLLNKGEFFFIKMLLNGSVDPEKLVFSIGVDDLPPTIVPKSSLFGPTNSPPHPTGKHAFFRGLLPLAVAVTTIVCLHDAIVANPRWLPGSERFEWFSWPTLVILGVAGGIVYWLTLATRSIVVRGLLGTKQRFRIPPSPADKPYAQFYGGGYAEPEIAVEIMRRLNHMPPQARRHILRQLGVMPPRLKQPPDISEARSD